MLTPDEREAIRHAMFEQDTLTVVQLGCDAITLARAVTRLEGENETAKQLLADATRFAALAQEETKRLLAENERMREAFQSAATCMATHPRDWSLDGRDAWLWGLIVGWGDALGEVSFNLGWSPEEVKRLAALTAPPGPDEKEGKK